jgi:hypothetical protein
LGLRWKRYLAELVAPVLACAALGIGLFLWSTVATAAHASPWVILLGAVPLGAALYPSALSLLGFDWRERLGQISGLSLKRAGKGESESLAPRVT